MESNEKNNPMGTDGFEFLEYSSPEPEKLSKQMTELGFKAIAKHRSKNVTLYRQGTINFILNDEPNSLASEFSKQHGAGCCAMGFRVKNAKQALERAVKLGAEPYKTLIGEGELEIPAIKGVGGSLIYFVDCYGKDTIYHHDFKPINGCQIDEKHKGVGLTYIDHVTHNLYRGNMDKLHKFYKDIFNFHQIRFFEITGEKTGLISRALESPCGMIKIPLNESLDDKSQIEEYLHEFNGEGIQHIALGTDDIYETVEILKKQAIKFLDVPQTYYEVIDERVPEHHEDLPRLEKNAILIDGNPLKGEGLLLQIFTENMLGPVFFEIIQRKGNEGFGEGNFQALFEAIERDQKKRGVL